MYYCTSCILSRSAAAEVQFWLSGWEDGTLGNPHCTFAAVHSDRIFARIHPLISVV